MDITPTQPLQPVAAAPPPPGDSLLRGQSAARIALSLALIGLGLYTLEGFLRALAWAAIIAVPTAVTGFYGQNVPYPGFGQIPGLVSSVALIVGLSALLFVLFKRNDWI